MTTKADIKKLLSKGLTGKEAGRLILQDNWEVDHQREGFLSERDIQAIKSSLKTTKDIEDYNSYVETYRILDYTLKEAHIKALEAHIRLDALSTLILMYLFDATSHLELYLRPVIVTEKQLQDNKTAQRERLLKELTSLHDILNWRARELTPEEIRGEYPEDDIDHFSDWVREAYPDLWRKAVSEILELVRSGKLQPVLIAGKDQERLDSLWNTIRELRSELAINRLDRDELLRLWREGSPPDDREISKKLRDLGKEEERLIRAAYKSRKSRISQKSQAALVSSLEDYLAGSLSQEEEDRLLEYTFASGEDLYQTGLPEWLTWIDEYKPGLGEEDLSDMRGIAVLVNPRPDMLDERGHYKRTYPTGLNKALTGDLLAMAEAFSEGIRRAKEEIKIVLSFASIAEAVSEVTGVDFTEDIKEWIKDLEIQVKQYNRLRQRVVYAESIPEEVKVAIQPLDLDRLKPYAKTIKYLQERIALGLGEGWYEDAKRALVEDLMEKEAQDVKEA